MSTHVNTNGKRSSHQGSYNDIRLKWMTSKWLTPTVWSPITTMKRKNKPPTTVWEFWKIHLALASGLRSTRMTESPRKNILEMYRSLLTGLDFFLPFPALGTSVHSSLTFSNTMLQCRSKAFTRANSFLLFRQLMRTYWRENHVDNQEFEAKYIPFGYIKRWRYLRVVLHALC